MSREYEMHVEVYEFRPFRNEAIRTAARNEWPFRNWSELDGVLTASAEDCLCGGETEEEFVERLSLAVWKANEAYCEITVHARNLDVHCLKQADYDKLLNATEPSRQKKTRTIEYFRLWPGNSGDSGTWDTDVIGISAHTPDNEIVEAVQKAVAAIDWQDGPPILTGVYNVPELEEDDEP